MTEPMQAPKVDPETLVLRAQPRRVVRFKRNALIGAAAIGCLGIAGVTWLGLRTPDRTTTAQKELYDPDKGVDSPKAKPERLQSLPKTYADVPSGVPQLGPPLPGDLGRPILEHQQAQGAVMSASPTGSTGPSQASPMAGLFFQVRDANVAAVPTASTALENTAQPTLPSVKSALPLNPDVDQNAQGRKLDFVEAKGTAGTYNAHGLQVPMSPYQVMAGTVISASLITGVNSDLPGMVISQVTEPVFDTVTGHILLIPQGTRLIGEYDSIIAFGQSRALLVWKRLIMPDGSSLEIDNLPATDTQGYAGLSDRIDYHTFSLIKGIGLSTLIGLTAQDGGSDKDSDLVKALRESTQQTANQAGQRIVEKTLNIQPGLSIRPGWPLRVIVHKDLILKPYSG